MFNSRASSSAAIKRLTIEYRQLSTDPNSLFPAVGPISEDNYLEWEALVPGPDGTPFEGGVFSARLKFPASYPLEPPTMRFEPPIFHPNVYADGLVCISILHAPGDDPNMYESSSERWSPVQSIEKILLSVLSMLAEPNVESGANIDACVSHIRLPKTIIDGRSTDEIPSSYTFAVNRRCTGTTGKGTKRSFVIQ